MNSSCPIVSDWIQAYKPRAPRFFANVSTAKPQLQFGKNQQSAQWFCSNRFLSLLGWAHIENRNSSHISRDVVVSAVRARNDECLGSIRFALMVPGLRICGRRFV